MFPDLIDIGFLHLKTYGACMATGFLVCWWLVERLSGRKDLSNFLLSLMVSGVIGSRLAYVIEHWQSEFAAHPARIIRVDQGGLMFYGGLILALAVFAVWCCRAKERPLALANLLATVIPLGHAFGRIGCFFYGCCYGRDSDAWCAVTFPIGSPSWHEHGRRLVSVLPTQLFEAAALLVLFAVLFVLYRRCRRYTAGVYFVGYAVIRFALECLRGDPRAAVGPFSISQTISLALIALGVLLLALDGGWLRRGARKEETPPQGASLAFEKLNAISGKDASDLESLTGLLSPESTFDRRKLDAAVRQGGTSVFVLRCAARIVAAATAVRFTTPTGVHCRIEDVVVSDGHRGRGLGRRIMTEVLGALRQDGVSRVELTSRPSREAANALYKSLGFARRETNVYEFTGF